MNIIRVWLYKAFQETEGKMDVLNKRWRMGTRVVRGEFQYFKVQDHVISASCRKEARKFEEETGHTVRLYAGYPDFMVVAGYKL